MSDPVWIPSLDDAGTDGLRARLRAVVLDALPELVASDRRGRDAGRPGRVEIVEPSGLAVRLEAAHVRSVMRSRRPVLEIGLRGTVRSPKRATGRPVEMPVDGVCVVDTDSGAVVHLEV